MTIVTSAFEKIPKGLIREDGINGNRKTSRDYPNYSIIEIGQNTEKSPGD